VESPFFIGGSYQSQAVTADQERTVNWYTEKMESPGGTSRAMLYPTPGVEQIGAASTGPGRAHFYMDGREFAVIGTTFYEIDEAGSLTSRGTVELDANPATICSNGAGGDQLFVTSGGNGYCYDLTANTITQITALNGKATQGDHLDGYFLALDANTATFYISNLLNGLSWSVGTDFAQRSIAPDRWLAMKVLGRYIWLFGEQTSEIWYNTGNTFPFEVHPSGLIPYGIVAPFSAAIADKQIMWLSTTRTGGTRVASAAGFSPEIVSDYALTHALESYAGTLSNSIGDSYQERGHRFYLITFPTQEATWAFDGETRQWAERGTWTPSENRYMAQRARWHAFAFGQHRVLDSVTGSVYRQGIDVTTDVDGLLIRRMRRSPALMVENQRVYYAAFAVDMEPGLGLQSGQGSDPQVMLRLSNDGGKTWGSEHLKSAGKQGAYQRKVKWNRLGHGFRRVFEISVTDPIPWRITNAYVWLGQQPEGMSPNRGQAQQGGAE
jgi:hypothetical protein